MGLLNKWKEIISKKCESFKKKNYPQTENPTTMPKCKSRPPSPWYPSPSSPSKLRVAPGGCFSVYVGPKKQRFVMRAKDANHPLFQMLLQDTEQQYGYNSDGPLLLACNVDLFCKVLAEIDSDSTDVIRAPVCGVYSSYNLLSPSRLLKINHF